MIKFIITAETGYVGCDQQEDFEVDEKDLEGIPKEYWADHVWEELGGKECAMEMVNLGIYLEEK